MHANADPAELQRFSDIAHRWWDPQGSMRPLHELNPLRLDWIDRLASLAGKRVLDVGCGGGVLAESMAARGAQVTGIDLASKLLKVAELHALESGISVDYRLSSAEDFAHTGREAGRYDVVTCMEMLEHVPDPASVVRACAALVRPDGWVFFSTINRNPKAFAFAILGAEYVLGLLPRGTHEYAKFIRPSEMASYARGAGLTLAELTGMTYNPLTRRFALAPDTDVNYLVACRRPVA
ncbi:MAG: bifunctional 2-polyprenyl-6-hydroxyphenol methylase/3-demethylubiquinol 3-O-methyltransferase UbiG [Burkholderiaceae bacterium]|nr:bifunctional 2-polyprenyl-6-hydroxyphenol methylase/3-demethylubiquinol 3-O-methyltransferase UbiG [Burkholderiaceae bacterium]